jgi:hypothetical protein
MADVLSRSLVAIHRKQTEDDGRTPLLICQAHAMQYNTKEKVKSYITSAARVKCVVLMSGCTKLAKVQQEVRHASRLTLVQNQG